MMRTFTFLLLFLAVLAPAVLAGGEGAPTVTVILPAEAEVPGNAIRVGDLARLVGDDALLVDAAAAIELGYAPAPGYSRLLENRDVGQALQRALPGVRWVFKGSRATRVWPATEVVRGESLLAAAGEALRSAATGRDVEFESSNAVADLVVPRSGSGATFTVEAQATRIATGQLSVPVVVHLDGQPYRRVNTVWSVRVYQQAPVLARSLMPGEVLTPSQFELRRVLLDTLNGGSPLPLAALRGGTAARKLEAGRPVTEADIHRPVVIRAGEGLMVEVSKGPVSARVVGLAIGSGAIGERIPVRLRDTGREMLATVISSELARVELGR